jgi:trigger factor
MLKKSLKPVLPELNAEFLTAFGVKEGDVDQFRADVRKNMERELRNAYSCQSKSICI